MVLAITEAGTLIGDRAVIHSSRRSAASLGWVIPVNALTEDEAVTFLAERTGLDNELGASSLAKGVGYLPLGLAHMAALIARDEMSYGDYARLAVTMKRKGRLGSPETNPCPNWLVPVINLSLYAAEIRDQSGRHMRLMGLMAVLAESGVPRWVLHQAASARVLGPGLTTSAEVDAALSELAEASLLDLTADGSVVAHQLVVRVARERLAAQGNLRDALMTADQTLSEMAEGISDARRDSAAVRELATQVGAVVGHLVSHQKASFAKRVSTNLLPLRQQSVRLLLDLGDSAERVILAAEPLLIDCEQLLGAYRETTLETQIDLALAYRAAGRTDEAIALLERAVAACEGLRGADDPWTAAVQSHLWRAYRAEGRTQEAIALLERVVAACERLLGADDRTTNERRKDLALLTNDLAHGNDKLLQFDLPSAKTSAVFHGVMRNS